MTLKHFRCQLPVGQGGFHYGSVATAGGALRYIYDCGSKHQDALRLAVLDTVRGLHDRPLDILFLSHLDHDHVSGLDQLLSFCVPDTVVLPYLTKYERFYLIAAAATSGRVSPSQLQLLCNPTRWFAERGATQVVYVTARRITDAEEIDWTVPPDIRSFSSHLDPQQTPISLPSRNPNRPNVDWNSVRHDPRSLFGSRRRDFRAIGVSCSDRLPIVIPKSQRPINWQFVMFVDPDTVREDALRRAVRKAFGSSLLSGSGFAIPSDVGFKVLRDPILRSKLSTCYRTLWRLKNRTSLSLYSGPVGGARFTYRVLHRHTLCAWRAISDVKGCGWLGTGDSCLKENVRCERFMAHFASLRQYTSTFTLPHHGSKANFNRRLRACGDVFSAAAGRNSSKHPASSVLKDLPDPFFLTTQDENTRLSEIAELSSSFLKTTWTSR